MNWETIREHIPNWETIREHIPNWETIREHIPVAILIGSIIGIVALYLWWGYLFGSKLASVIGSSLANLK